jgi:hypothetical protein
MSTPPKPDHRSLPRKKRLPSARDQAIYVSRMARGCSQASLAKEHRLSQSRISQILRRVERWRANLRPSDCGELDHAQRQRIERQLERERHQELYDRGLRGFDSAPQQLTTKKEGKRGENDFTETTTREVLPNVQWLKLSQRSAEALAKAADKPAPPAPRDESLERGERIWRMMETLITLRREAEEAGKVATSRAHQHDNYSPTQTVESWLDALLGEKPNWIAAVHLAAGSPLDELTRWFDELKQEHARRAAAASGGTEGRRERETEGWSEGEPETHGQTQSNALTPSLLPSASPSCYAVHPSSPGPTNPSNASNAHANATPQLPLAPTLAADSRSAKTPPDNTAPPPDGANVTSAERRRLHQLRLDQLQRSRRRGLPVQFVFDPADGPLPAPYFHLDGAS